MASAADFQFAEIVLHNRLAAKEEVDHALKVMEETKKLGLHLTLASILVDLGILSASTADAVRQLPGPMDGPRFDSGVHPLDDTQNEELRLGSLAVHNLILSADDLLEALRYQEGEAKRGNRLMLGEILVDRKMIDRFALDSLMEFQRTLAQRQKAGGGLRVPLLNAEDLLFGTLLISNGLVSPKQVQECIRLQREIKEKTGIEQRLGEVVFERGYVDRKAIDLLLQLQRIKMKAEGPALALDLTEVSPEQESRLGDVLAEGRVVTPEQVAEALEIQKMLRELGINRKMGEVLILRGYLDANKLEAALNLQERRRSAHGRSRLPGGTDPQSALAVVLGVVLALGGLVALAAYIANEPAPPPPERPSPSGPGPDPVPVPPSKALPGTSPSAGGGALAVAAPTAPEARVLREIDRSLLLYRFRAAAATCDALLGLDLAPALRAHVERRKEEAGRYAALLDRLLAALAAGRIPEPVLRNAFRADAGVRVRSADAERVVLDAARDGTAIEAAWAALPPSQVLPLFLELGLTPAELLVAADLAGELHSIDEGHEFLVRARARDPALAAETDARVARWLGQPVPPRGFVVCRRRLVTEEERGKLEEGLVPFAGRWETVDAIEKLETGRILKDGSWVAADKTELLAAGLLPFRERWYPPQELERVRQRWESAWEVTTEHWHIRTNVGSAYARDLVKLLEEAHEEFRRFLGSAPPAGVTTLWVFRDFEGYRRFCQSEGQLARLEGDWSSVASEGKGVTYDPGLTEEDRQFAALGAAAAAYFDRTFAKAAPSPWYRQALCDYLAAATVAEAGLMVGRPCAPFLAWLRAPLVGGRLPALEAVVRGDTAAAGKGSAALGRVRLRAAGWSFYHFLQNSPRTDDHARLRMYEGAGRGPAAQPAADPWQVFRDSFGEGLGAVEDEWRTYVQRL